MEFSLQRSKPSRRIAGLALVGVAHIAVIAALMFGMTRSHTIFAPPAPIEWVSIVEPLRPPQKLETRELPRTAPAPVVMVPPTIVLDQPPLQVDSIQVSPDTSAPQVADSAAASGAASDGATSASAGLAAACPNAQAIRASLRYPPQARREGLQGDVLARFVVGSAGDIRNVDIVSSSQRAFNSTVINAVRQFNCVAQGRDVVVEVPFTFRLE